MLGMKNERGKDPKGGNFDGRAEDGTKKEVTPSGGMGFFKGLKKIYNKATRKEDKATSETSSFSETSTRGRYSEEKDGNDKKMSDVSRLSRKSTNKGSNFDIRGAGEVKGGGYIGENKGIGTSSQGSEPLLAARTATSDSSKWGKKRSMLFWGDNKDEINDSDLESKQGYKGSSTRGEKVESLMGGLGLGGLIPSVEKARGSFMGFVGMDDKKKEEAATKKASTLAVERHSESSNKNESSVGIFKTESNQSSENEDFEAGIEDISKPFNVKKHSTVSNIKAASGLPQYQQAPKLVPPQQLLYLRDEAMRLRKEKSVSNASPETETRKPSNEKDSFSSATPELENDVQDAHKTLYMETNKRLLARFEELLRNRRAFILNQDQQKGVQTVLEEDIFFLDFEERIKPFIFRKWVKPLENLGGDFLQAGVNFKKSSIRNNSSGDSIAIERSKSEPSLSAHYYYNLNELLKTNNTDTEKLWELPKGGQERRGVLSKRSDWDSRSDSGHAVDNTDEPSLSLESKSRMSLLSEYNEFSTNLSYVYGTFIPTNGIDTDFLENNHSPVSLKTLKDKDMFTREKDDVLHIYNKLGYKPPMFDLRDNEKAKISKLENNYYGHTRSEYEETEDLKNIGLEFDIAKAPKLDYRVLVLSDEGDRVWARGDMFLLGRYGFFDSVRSSTNFVPCFDLIHSRYVNDVLSRISQSRKNDKAFIKRLPKHLKVEDLASHKKPVNLSHLCKVVEDACEEIGTNNIAYSTVFLDLKAMQIDVLSWARQNLEQHKRHDEYTINSNSLENKQKLKQVLETEDASTTSIENSNKSYEIIGHSNKNIQNPCITTEIQSDSSFESLYKDTSVAVNRPPPQTSNMSLGACTNDNSYSISGAEQTGSIIEPYRVGNFVEKGERFQSSQKENNRSESPATSAINAVHISSTSRSDTNKSYGGATIRNKSFFGGRNKPFSNAETPSSTPESFLTPSGVAAPKSWASRKSMSIRKSLLPDSKRNDTGSLLSVEQADGSKFGKKSISALAGSFLFSHDSSTERDEPDKGKAQLDVKSRDYRNIPDYSAASADSGVYNIGNNVNTIFPPQSLTGGNSVNFLGELSRSMKNRSSLSRYFEEINKLRQERWIFKFPVDVLYNFETPMHSKNDNGVDVSLQSPNLEDIEVEGNILSDQLFPQVKNIAEYDRSSLEEAEYSTIFAINLYKFNKIIELLEQYDRNNSVYMGLVDLSNVHANEFQCDEIGVSGKNVLKRVLSYSDVEVFADNMTPYTLDDRKNPTTLFEKRCAKPTSIFSTKLYFQKFEYFVWNHTRPCEPGVCTQYFRNTTHMDGGTAFKGLDKCKRAMSVNIGRPHLPYHLKSSKNMKLDDRCYAPVIENILSTQ
ncbi:hypothetical protein AX774_g3911 [Zancudomyces culisetae]|uniref:Uncharacterized protein n=1 Tax=Zancudomyces culisetae TaxID=1213189 RepID=A0A1R1PNQ9_ZANCU|nr:hypothetical protein AX774_g3911 [Zancudomyces culisetae]|eukprot:OMH82606.1 hypothetical protein AX774_g3911 [Zancudomyces culisetae]